MQEDVNPLMILIARESRELTQSELSKMLEISQGELSKVENGEKAAPQELLSALSSVLDYPESFFLERMAFHHLPVTFFRKKQSLSVKKKKKIHAKLNVYLLHLKKLLRSVDIPENRVPKIEIPKRGSAYEQAEIVRAHWNIPPGPIKHLMALLESKGVLLIPFDFESDVDGLSVYDVTSDALPPIIVYNKNMPNCRIRFTLAHEFAHHVLHHHQILPSSDCEKEANEFAAAFLMPEEDLISSLKRLDLRVLADLKKTWRVSMKALLYRAKELSAISEHLFRKLIKEYSTLQFNRGEPIEIEPEYPKLLQQTISLHFNQLSYTHEDLSKVLSVSTRELSLMYPMCVEKPRLRLVL